MESDLVRILLGVRTMGKKTGCRCPQISLVLLVELTKMARMKAILNCRCGGGLVRLRNGAHGQCGTSAQAITADGHAHEAMGRVDGRNGPARVFLIFSLIFFFSIFFSISKFQIHLFNSNLYSYFKFQIFLQMPQLKSNVNINYIILNFTILFSFPNSSLLMCF
jgi:hypothetical protein